MQQKPALLKRNTSPYQAYATKTTLLKQNTSPYQAYATKTNTFETKHLKTQL